MTESRIALEMRLAVDVSLLLRQAHKDGLTHDEIIDMLRDRLAMEETLRDRKRVVVDTVDAPA